MTENQETTEPEVVPKTHYKTTTLSELLDHMKELQVKSQSYFQAAEGIKELRKSLIRRGKFLNPGQYSEVEKDFGDGEKIIYRVKVDEIHEG